MLIGGLILLFIGGVFSDSERSWVDDNVGSFANRSYIPFLGSVYWSY